MIVVHPVRVGVKMHVGLAFVLVLVRVNSQGFAQRP
jgi:hypothetical protein